MNNKQRKTCVIEVVSGPEGPSLYIGDQDGGYRLAGPKPWGGGRTLHSFEVSIDTLVREARSLGGADLSTQGASHGE